MDKNDIVIVTGLPRSGTSLMMQILHSAGIDVFIDNIRQPDVSNPNGYFEHQLVKTIEQDSSWVNNVRGKAIKIVSPLIKYLPENINYKIIFMERDLSEIIQSQEKMMLENESSDNQVNPNILKKLFIKDLQQVKAWINHQPNIKVIFISYRNIVNEFDKVVSRLEEFLNISIDQEKTRLIIDKSLYRTKID